MNAPKRKKISLILSQFDLSCLKYAIENLAPRGDSSHAATIASAAGLVDRIRAAWDAAPEFTKRLAGDRKPARK